MRWLRLSLKYFAWGIVLMLAGGAILQAIASSRTLHHPPGKLVDMGGRRMHLYCTGQGPTVVLDAGLGDSWMTWKTVQPAIAQFARVCSYDRAGMGWSDPSPNSRDSKTIAGELHAMLHAAAIPTPYFLVGHSFGGPNIRAYRDAFPADVAGLVMIDASHPDQMQRLPPEVKQLESRFQILARAIEVTMPFGLPRLAGACPEGSTAECGPNMIREIVAEYAMLPKSFDEVRGAKPLGDLPLRVLSRDPSHIDAGVPPGIARASNAVWSDLQKELTALSTNSKQTVAEGCGHYIHQCKPELVIAAIRELAVQSAGGISAPDPGKAAR